MVTLLVRPENRKQLSIKIWTEVGWVRASVVTRLFFFEVSCKVVCLN